MVVVVRSIVCGNFSIVKLVSMGPRSRGKLKFWQFSCEGIDSWSGSKGTDRQSTGLIASGGMLTSKKLSSGSGILKTLRLIHTAGG
jgi:hypothetical protein